MAEDASPFQYFAADRSGRSLHVIAGTSEYDPEIGKEIDRAIRWLPMVTEHCHNMAQKVKDRAGENFRVFDAGGAQRPRSYVVPDNSEGIRQELNDGVLLKAAISMQGKS